MPPYFAGTSISGSTAASARRSRRVLRLTGATPFTDNRMSSGTMHTVGLPKGDWTDNLPQVRRGESTYGEPHMGAGEQKVIRLIQALEAAKPRSLILLEEPEITLHPDAQKGLAWYLMSLARRKGHQIIVATHSAALFET